MSTRNHHTRRPALAPTLLAVLCALPCSLLAQDKVVITGSRIERVGVAGFGDVPLQRAPLQAVAWSPAQLADAGVASLGALTRLDASVGDAYNAEGYWAILSARGYTLDNRFNYRRDGLPINAETALALDNKERLELLKGTSGIQAGTSAPGGLVNLVVKRPVGRLRNARIEWRSPGSVLGAVDLGERFGADDAVGVRVNAAAERLDPPQRHTRGERHLLAAAVDWRLGADSLLQAEVETSHQRQPSAVGFSLLGSRVPDAGAIDPRINLNDQPWRQPVVLDGDTASLRWRQRLAAGWRLELQAMQQMLRSDDRTAFPFGCGAEGNFDRYCSDGTFDLYEFISDNERRNSRALSATLAGTLQAAGLEHQLETGVLLARYTARLQNQIFNFAGIGSIDGSLQTARSNGPVDGNTNRDERSTELFVRDAVKLTTAWEAFIGLRHTRLERKSQRTLPHDDSLGDKPYEQSFTTPWLALSYTLSPGTQAYASWGRGLESDATPSRARYSNPGETFTLQSRQFELGLKHAGRDLEAALALFDIDRPQTADIGACGTAGTCTRIVDGSARHRGLEASGLLRSGTWQWHAGAMWLDAQRRGSSRSGVNGSTPVNVPRGTLRLGTEWAPAALQDVAFTAQLSAEGKRHVLPDDASITIPGWQRLDLGARWRQQWAGGSLVWRLGIDNATDQRAWKESPYQFSHVYLYPLAPRTWRASVQGSF